MRLEIENYIGVGEASIILGSSRTAVYDWIKAGRLNTFIIGKHVLLTRTEVEEFAASRKTTE